MVPNIKYKNNQNSDPYIAIQNEIEEINLKESKYKIVPLSEYLNPKNITGVKWLVDGFIPQGRAVLLSGREGTFKSLITQHIAYCITNGEAVFSTFPVKQGKVLIIDKENSREILLERFNKMGSPNNEIYFMDWDSQQDFFLTNQSEEVDKFLDGLATQGFSLIILDSFIRFSRDNDENSASDIKKINEKINRLLHKDITVLVIDHHNKSESNPMNAVRGSTEKRAFVDIHYSVEIIDERNSIIKLDNPKARIAKKIDPFTIRLIDKPNLSFAIENITFDPDVSNKREISRKLIIDKLSQSETARFELVKQVSENGGYAEAETDKLLKDLVVKGNIFEKTETRNNAQVKVFYL